MYTKPNGSYYITYSCCVRGKRDGTRGGGRVASITVFGVVGAGSLVRRVDPRVCFFSIKPHALVI